ncbi:MAG: hypothetical protein P8O78_05430 [Flavobacteriaceae bacterium]|nr:hypothetical protein [Flavobacteriaceae bacterium]
MRLLIFLLLIPNFLIAQNINEEIAALKDSIILFKNSNPDKSIFYGFEVISMADFNNPTKDLISVHNHIGEILFNRNLDAEALRFYNQSLKLFEAIPKNKRKEKKIKFLPWILVNIGNVYFKNNNFAKAKEKYLEAEVNFKLYDNKIMQSQGIATINDNLALIALENNNFNEAQDHFNTSYLLRKKSNKVEDIIYSHLGFLTVNMHKDDLFKINFHFNKIEKLYELEKVNYTPKELSTSFLLRNYGYAYSIMGDYYKGKENYTAAIDYYKQALNLLERFPVELPQLQVNVAESYLALNDMEKAMSSAQNNLIEIRGNFFAEEKKRNFLVLESIYEYNSDNINLIKVKDSLIKIVSFGATLNLGDKFNELESNILLSKKRSELNESKIKYNTYLFILIIGSTILLFSLISLRLNFNLQKEKSEKIISEKKYIEASLEHKKMELVNKSNYISQRNKNLNYILESVDKVDNSDKNESTHIIKEKIALILKSENINNRFEKQFEEVYPGFFKDLIARSSHLSQNDLRLCAYLKMNQSTKEIAQLSGVSIRTIESQKYRLKKKFNLSKEENLIHFLFTL